MRSAIWANKAWCMDDTQKKHICKLLFHVKLYRVHMFFGAGQRMLLLHGKSCHHSSKYLHCTCFTALQNFLELPHPAAVVLSQKAFRSNSLICLMGWSEGLKTDRTLLSLILNHDSTAYTLLSLFSLLWLALMAIQRPVSRSAPKQNIHTAPVP